MADIRIEKAVEYEYPAEHDYFFTDYHYIRQIAVSHYGDRIAALSNIYRNRTRFDVHVWNAHGRMLGSTIDLSHKDDSDYIMHGGLAFVPEREEIMLIGVNHSEPWQGKFLRNFKSWNYVTTEMTHPFGTRMQPVWMFKTSRDMRYFYFGNHYWDRYSDENTKLPDVEGPAGSSYAISPDGSVVCGGGVEPYFASFKNGKLLEISTIRGGPTKIYSFSPNGECVITSFSSFSSDCFPPGKPYYGCFDVWSSGSFTKLTTVNKPRELAYISQAEFSANGLWVITGHGDGSISLWDVNDEFRLVYTKQRAENRPIREIASAWNDGFVTNTGYEITRWKIVG